MPTRVENITLKCPKCLMPHNYRLRVKFRFVGADTTVFKDTEKIYLTRTFFCIGLNEPFDTKIPIYFSKNERIETVEVRE